jgi:hypothetical protein
LPEGGQSDVVALLQDARVVVVEVKRSWLGYCAP